MVEELTKKGYSGYLYYLTIPAFIVFFILNYYLPIYFVLEFDSLDLMISVVSFLFGFFITICFTMLLNKIAILKNNFAIETGRLVSLYSLSKKLGKRFSDKVREVVDKYTVDTMRHYSSYDISRDSMYEFYESLNLAELKTENQKADFNSFLYILGEFSVTRQNLEYLTKKSLLWALKFTNYILAVILIFLLFLNRGSTFSNTLFMVLSTVIVFILLIIEDYESLRIGGYTYNAANSEQLFDLLGVRRYYPASVLGRVVLEPGKIYRIGVYDKSIGKDKIVDMRYSPTKGLMKYHPLKGLKKLKPSKKFFRFKR